MGQFGSGASLAFKTAALRRLGGFAAELGAGTSALGGEDLDVFLRLLVDVAGRVAQVGRAEALDAVGAGVVHFGQGRPG